MRRRLAVLALVAGLCAGAVPAAAGVVGRETFAQAQRGGLVAVVVAMRQLGSRGSAGLRALTRQRRRALMRGLRARGAVVTHEYTTVGGFAALVSAADLTALAADPDVARVDLDAEGRGALASSVPQIGADRVHNLRVTGVGTVIAVLDSGVERDHPDLADALIHEECFCSRPQGSGTTGCCPGGIQRGSGPGSAPTLNVHGVHDAGIALSRGRVAPRGVAPGAALVAVRVVDDNLIGRLSDWIAALDWIAAARPDVRVVSMSLSSVQTYSGVCDRHCDGQPQCALNMLFGEIIDELFARGTLVFAASGNDGPLHTLTSPACVERAVSVGAVDGRDTVASFSNGSAALDLLAPGVDIVSSGLDGGTALIREGTSLATPHAAGTAALLFSASPGSRAETVLDTMRATGVPVRDGRTGVTTPRVDAFAAFRALTAHTELLRGGGSHSSDCLLEWSFIPSDIARDGTRALARCRDGDLFCDLDDEPGQCTFGLSLCFNAPDPLLRGCAVDEPLLRLALEAPRLDAPAGSLERQNADTLHHSLPAFPIDGASVCGVPFPVVVPRAGGRGVTSLRLAAHTATRMDYDRVDLICEAP